MTKGRIFVGGDLKGSTAIFDFQLANSCNSSEGKMVLAAIVTPYLFQTAPSLEPTIDGFMTCSSSAHGFAMPRVPSILRSARFGVSFVACVSHHFLSRKKNGVQFYPKYLKVGHFTTRDGAVEPYNVFACNANTNLVAKTGTLELV